MSYSRCVQEKTRSTGTEFQGPGSLCTGKLVFPVFACLLILFCFSVSVTEYHRLSHAMETGKFMSMVPASWEVFSLHRNVT